MLQHRNSFFSSSPPSPERPQGTSEVSLSLLPATARAALDRPQQAAAAAPRPPPPAPQPSSRQPMMQQQPHAPGSGGATSTHFPLLALPDAALAAVLRALAQADCSAKRTWQRPPPPRSVLSAGRACRRLHAAATAALDSISVNSATQQRVDSLQLYLRQHGQHVTSVDVNVDGDYYLNPFPQLLSLPASCSSLRALTLQWMDVQLGAGSGAAGVLATASALTSLRILDGRVLDTADGAAAAVARLTGPGLQHLDLWSRFNDASAGVLPGSTLAPLTGLTALELGGECMDDSSLEHLSSLSGSLQDLHLGGSSFAASLTAVQHLRQLTTLNLSCVRGPAISLPGLSRLSGLQKLEMHYCESGLDPHSLAACSQLRDLLLDQTPVAGGADGVAALLGHLQACTQLTHLLLEEALREHAPSPAAYAGLTASSSLEVLKVYGVPVSAWQPMFGGSGKSLPRLRALSLWLDDETPADADAGEEAAAAGLTPADMQALVRCCPALQELGLYNSTGLADAGLVSLTALTQLTSLSLASHGLSAAVRGTRNSFRLHSKERCINQTFGSGSEEATALWCAVLMLHLWLPLTTQQPSLHRCTLLAAVSRAPACRSVRAGRALWRSCRSDWCVPVCAALMMLVARHCPSSRRQRTTSSISLRVRRLSVQLSGWRWGVCVGRPAAVDRHRSWEEQLASWGCCSCGQHLSVGKGNQSCS